MCLKNLINYFPNIANIIELFSFNQPYWVELKTKQPNCIYYFGPFQNYFEAEKMQHGYIQDLIEEKAIGISVQIKRCSPIRLTIEEEEEFA